MKSRNVPRHIAIIMDGNGRWAGLKRQNRIFGHREGAETVRRIVDACRVRGVEFLTLYAFSEENWGRPRTEIAALMKILKRFLISERPRLQRDDVRLRVIGDISKLSKEVQQTLDETLRLTCENKGMSLVLALSYGGRDEITRAVRKVADEVERGRLKAEEITPKTIESHLDTVGIPDPDLLIRTSGEFRISNFLSWQTAYTELYITQTLWPDFSAEHLDDAINDFSKRERRFGLTSGQVIKPKGRFLWSRGR